MSRTFADNPEFANRVDCAIRQRYPREGPAKLSLEFGLSQKSIATRAFRIGVKTDMAIRQSRRIATKRAINTSVNHAYFETWSPNMAWLLGYIWTDGAILTNGRYFKLVFRCQAGDGHIIHDIRDELQSQHKVQTFSAIQCNGYAASDQIGISINSKQLVECLIDQHGIPQNKSNLNPPLPKIPDEYMSHFVRGFCDGDGSITRSRGNRGANYILYGSHLAIEILNDRLLSLTGIYNQTIKRHKQSTTLSILRWSSAREVLAILSWTYPANTGLALRRKLILSHTIATEGLMGRGLSVRLLGNWCCPQHQHLTTEPHDEESAACTHLPTGPQTQPAIVPQPLAPR